MEFTNVKSNDFIELAGIPEHLHSTTIAEHRVKWRLRGALEAIDIHEPIERLHYTTWDSNNGTVNYSQTLIELLVDAVLHSEAPTIGPAGGIFSARGVNGEEHHVAIDLAAVHEAASIVYRHIKQTEQAD
ncbi:hypothetical protein [Pseudomonas sp. CC120222-01a]|uniref:hypothetical protein n=1 Tax=Pseudomonas sp. CC120222-01a TaxID=1378075 RepID=UPI000D8D2FCD|nr:hypothetical protein [Pseudomonas sp. CC120222-01a]PVZ39303.1 hypothetical protein N430_03853 [Pseudomonas sp. CC120222-01a]